MARIRVVGTEEPIDAPAGVTLLAALKQANSPISTSCGGRALCGLCRVTVTEGWELLSPVTDEEVAHIGNVAKVVNIRLACQAKVTGDGEVVLDVPPVVDVAARKREQTRRGFAERALRRRSRPGGPKPVVDRASRPRPEPQERIEWRPRKLEEMQSAEPDNPKNRRRK